MNTFPSEIRVFEVGGCIRDELLGVATKDIDFAVEALSFDHMKQVLLDLGFKIHTEKPEFFTIRAKFPKTWNVKAKDVDFVLCRKDGSTSDGRRPDEVFAGTLFDDLERRDFSVNAIAREFGTDQLIDPFNGVADLERKVLRFVGDPRDRIKEDGLRVLRGFRFQITKNLRPETLTNDALTSRLAADMLFPIPADRKREEVSKMFKHSTLASIGLIADLPGIIAGAIFTEGLHLDATQKGV